MYDVHSIGGVPGNKYAPIVVSIAAAAGLRVPKTSSRAISSACGTADFMEVLAPVAFDSAQLRAITESVGATLAWGGGVALAPADDEIIRVEYPLGIDPPAQIVASVLAKKVAMGVSKVLIDLPSGPGAKVHDRRAADDMVRRFMQVGSRLGLEVRCEITSGSRPLGTAVGPILEAREMLSVLETGLGPQDLVDKSCRLAGLLLEMAGKAAPGQGLGAARGILASGAAHKKFLAIVAAQGGKATVRSGDLVPGPHAFEAAAVSESRFELDNADLVRIARAAGSPHAKGAGVQLLHAVGEPVRAGQPTFRVYAETAAHLANAWEATQRLTGFQCRPLPVATLGAAP
jgi:AMP phosphorylase